MRIGSAIFLIALGAILAWAVTPGLIPNVNQAMIGYILMVVGVIGLIASLVLVVVLSEVCDHVLAHHPSQRVLQLRQLDEQVVLGIEARRHLWRLEVELRRVAHPPFVLHHLAGADTDHHIVGLVVAPFQKMDVIGCN